MKTIINKIGDIRLTPGRFFGFFLRSTTKARCGYWAILFTLVLALTSCSDDLDVQLTEEQADALLRKDLAKCCALYSQYGKDSVLLGALAYNCGPGVVNKSSILKKLKSGNRNIFKAYTSHCRYKGKWHKGLYNRRLTELAALFAP